MILKKNKTINFNMNLKKNLIFAKKNINYKKLCKKKMKMKIYC